MSALSLLRRVRKPAPVPAAANPAHRFHAYRIDDAHRFAWVCVCGAHGSKPSTSMSWERSKHLEHARLALREGR